MVGKASARRPGLPRPTSRAAGPGGPQVAASVLLQAGAPPEFLGSFLKPCHSASTASTVRETRAPPALGERAPDRLSPKGPAEGDRHRVQSGSQTRARLHFSGPGGSVADRSPVIKSSVALGPSCSLSQETPSLWLAGMGLYRSELFRGGTYGRCF